MKLNKFLALAFLLWVSLFVCAQSPVSFTSDQGLSNTCIRSMKQDSRKNVWICTQYGLNRFDGAKMNVYHYKSDEKGSLGHDNTTCVLEQEPGKILVGLEIGVQSYSYDTDEFTDIPLISWKGDTIKAHVVSMAKLSDGTVYVCTAGYGLFVLKEEKGLEKLTEINTFPQSVPPLQIMEDSQKRVWVLYPSGMVYCRVNGKFHPVGTYKSGSRLCESSSGRIYLASVYGGLRAYSETDRQFHEVDETSKQYVIASVTAAPNGTLFISTDGNGLKVYDEKTGKIEQSNIRTYEYNLATSNVKDAMMDADGNVWVGVYWKGVWVMPNTATSFEYIGRRSVHKNTLGTNCVTAITGDGKGALWVATDHCGVYHLAADGTSSVHFKPELVSGMPSTVMSLLEDSEGSLWLGSSWAGVAKMNKETGECTNLGEWVKGGERIKNAYTMVEDKHKNIWIGSMGDGLYCYTRETGELIHYLPLDNSRLKYPYHLLYNAYVRVLLVSENYLYVGSADGLQVFLCEGNRLKHVGRYLQKFGINDMKITPDRKIWFASTEGLGFLDLNNKTVTVYTVKDGLPCNSISSIELAPDGKIWAGTNVGMSSFDPVKKDFENYYINDGLQGNEFSVKASYSLNGHLYFGGINGLTFFRPSEVEKREDIGKPELRLIDFYVNGKPVHVGDRSGNYKIIDSWFPMVKEVNLSHQDRSFAIELSTMNFNSRCVIYYSINSGDWMAVGDGQNRISFINMEPGTYHIRIKADAYGKMSDVKEVKVIIHPAWYLSGVAICVYVVLLIVASYIVYLQIKDKLETKRMLEKHRQAEELNEARIQFFMNISHEIRTPMTLILGPLMKLMKMDTDKIHQRNYSLIYQNSQRILRLINQLMDARKIEKGQFSLKYHKVELVGFINNLYELFETTANNRHITFRFIHEMDKLEVCIDPQNFDKVVMNLLSNAFKFTSDGGEITIELQDVEGQQTQERDFVLMVTDSGVGISNADKKRIFERFYSGNGGDYVGTGIGLNLTKLLVELHEGEIKVEDNPAGKGSRFVVRMPQTLQMLEGIVDDSLPEASYSLPPKPEHVVETGESLVSEKTTQKKLYNVMIVEDEAAIRRYLRNELSIKCNVIETANGQEAWDYIIQNPERVDLVVSDVMMPVMDGITLCQKIKTNFNTNHISVVLLSAKNDDADKLKGLNMGADAYMTKPFNIDVLCQTVNNLLESRHRLQGKLTVTSSQEENMEKIELTSPDERLMERLMKVINENISNPDLNVEFISDKVGISRVHLHRRLKEMTSLTPRDFIRNIRLSQAAKLLSDKHLDITDVSVATGFKSVSTFSTCFKTYYGMTPTEYMRKNTKSKEENDENKSSVTENQE